MPLRKISNIWNTSCKTFFKLLCIIYKKSFSDAWEKSVYSQRFTDSSQKITCLNWSTLRSSGMVFNKIMLCKVFWKLRQTHLYVAEFQRRLAFSLCVNLWNDFRCEYIFWSTHGNKENEKGPMVGVGRVQGSKERWCKGKPDKIVRGEGGEYRMAGSGDKWQSGALKSLCNHISLITFHKLLLCL